MPGSSPQRYDVIIIGSGVGGLTAAALLAKAGRKVLLVEKSVRVGGYFSPLVHGPYEFVNGPRLLMGCNPDGPHGPGIIHDLLAHLGVQERCTFIRVQPFMDIRLPGLSHQVWSGRQAYIEGLRTVCPRGLENLADLLELCSWILETTTLFVHRNKPRELARLVGRLPKLARYSRATLESVLRRFFPEPKARTVVGATWPYLVAPPQEAAFLYWAALMVSYIDEGAYFCRGGLTCLAEALAHAYRREGGELRLTSTVTRILVENRTVAGVELADGQRFMSTVVLANIDPRQVFGQLVVADPAGARLTRYVHGLNHMELSMRGINLAMVTDLDLPGMGLAFDTFVMTETAAEHARVDPAKAQPGFISIVAPTIVDTSLAPPGQHLLSIAAGVPVDYEFSPENVQRSADGLLRATEQRCLPGLTSHLMLAGSDELPRGYLTHVYEPIYGWALVPRHAGLRRLTPRTPVKGLRLVGQWTRPGAGGFGVIVSGMEAARQVLG